MRWLLGVLVVAGCGRSHFDDAGNDGPGGGDRDGDGIADAADNCPAVFNQSQADMDGDKVGDSCDPRPTAPGDVLYDTSIFAGTFGSWTPDAIANWQRDAGGVTTTAAADQVDATLSFPTAITRPTLELGFVVVDGGTSTPYSNQLVATVSYSGGGESCAAMNGNSTTIAYDFVQIAHGGSYDGSTIQTFPQPLGANVPATLRVTLDDVGTRCAAYGASYTSQYVRTNVASTGFLIHIKGVKATLSYATIYGIP